MPRWPRTRSSRKWSKTCGVGRAAVSASTSRSTCRPAIARDRAPGRVHDALPVQSVAAGQGHPSSFLSGSCAPRSDRPRALPPQPRRDRVVYLATVWPIAVARLGVAVAYSGETHPSRKREVRTAQVAPTQARNWQSPNHFGQVGTKVHTRREGFARNRPVLEPICSDVDRFPTENPGLRRSTSAENWLSG